MNYKFLSKYGQLIGFALGAVPILLFVLILLIGGEDAAINFELYSGIVLFIIGAVVLVGFGLFQTLSNPKGSIKGLIGFGGLALVFLVIYFTATPETIGSIAEARTEFSISDGQTKLISGGMGLAFILLLGAILAFFYSEVRNLFK